MILRELRIDGHGPEWTHVCTAGVPRGHEADEGLGCRAHQAERLAENLARVVTRQTPAQHAPVHPHVFPGRFLPEHVRALEMREGLGTTRFGGAKLRIDVGTDVVSEATHGQALPLRL